MKSVHTLASSFLQTRFNVIHPAMPRPTSPILCFRLKFCKHFLSLLTQLTVTYSTFPLCLFTFNKNVLLQNKQQCSYRTVWTQLWLFYPEDGGNNLVRNVYKFVTSDTAAQHRSSHLPPPQPQISDIKIEAQYCNVDKLQMWIAVREVLLFWWA